MAVADAQIPQTEPARAVPSLVLPGVLGVLAAFIGMAISGARWGPLEVLAGTTAVLAAGAFVLWRPKEALRLSFFLILLATTKFRERSALALLSGDFDAQIIFELVCYAAAMFVILVNLAPAFRRGGAVPLTRTDLLLGAYVLLAVASVLWSVHAQVTLGRAVQLVTLYLLCAVSVRRLGAAPTLATLATAVVTYVLAAAALAAVFPWAQHQHAGDRFAWFASHPIETATLASSAAVTLLCGVWYASDAWRQPAKRLVAWVALLTCVAVLLAAHARAPLFAFAVAACALWVRRRLRPGPAALALGVALLIVGAGLAALAASYGEATEAPDPGNPIVVYLLRGQSGEEFLGLSGRTELWEYVSTLAGERPFFGHGYVASRSVLLERFPWAGTSHGALPEIVLDLGMAGAFLLGIVLLSTLLSAFRGMARTGPDAWGDAMVLGSLVFLIVLAVANDSFAGAPGYEVLLFLAVVMAHPHLRNVTREDSPAA